MREILFRGKRVDNGEWVEGCYPEFVHGFDGYTKPGIQVIRCVPSVANRLTPTYETELVEVTPETIGQYTGIADTNGNKIFEGDIIVLSNDSVKGEIFFNEKISAFQLRYLGELGELFEPKFLGEWITRYSIVGNIHDEEEEND